MGAQEGWEPGLACGLAGWDRSSVKGPLNVGRMGASLVLWSTVPTDRLGDSDPSDDEDPSDDSNDGMNVEDVASKTDTSVKDDANKIKSRTDAS